MARSTMTAPFVGRAAQVATFSAALERAAGGHPSAILLGADAGVGKTRLLGQVAELAGRTGATAVTVHCIDLGEVGLPYLPFAEALAELRRLTAVAEAVDRVAADRPALARLLSTGSVGPSTGGEDQSGRLPLFDGIAAVLGEAGTPTAPLVLIIEDLHWADPSSRDVLRFLISRLRREHLLLVASYRSDDLHRTHPLRPVLAELARHPLVERIDLPPFTDAELREFTTGVHGRALSEAALQRIAERSEGNAYFAEELVEAGPDADRLPGSLADILRSRLEQAHPQVHALARIASVAGRRVTEALLRAVATDRLGGSAAVDTALREAVAHNVLHGEDGRIAFRHALLAEAVYTDLLPGEHVALHRAYLEAIVAEPGLGSPAELAYHARCANEARVTVHASLDAAWDAAQVLAPAEELRHLTTALRFWDSVPDAATVVGQDKVTVLRRAADAASRSGRPQSAVALAREAVATAEGDTARQPSVRIWLARHLLGLDRDQEAYAESTRALADLPPDAPARDRAWALATHARVALSGDRDDEARASAAHAAEVARAGGEPAAEADALATLAVLVVDDPQSAAELLTTAGERARDAGDLLTEQRCAYNLATTYYYAGRLEECATTIHDLLERSRSTGLGLSEFGVNARFFLQLVRYDQGDLTPGASSSEYFSSAQPELFPAVALYAAVARGDADAVARGRALQQVWTKDAQVALIAGGCLIDALTWNGDLDAAVKLGTSLIDHLGRTWDDYFLGGIWLGALVIAALADGAAADRLAGVDPTPRVRLGAEALDRVVQTSERGRPRGGRLGPEGIGWLARARAEHSRLLGENDPELWRQAADGFAYGYRYEQARSRWRWAESLLGAGDRTAAQVELSAAAEVAISIGAGPLSQAVQALARRGRLDVRGAHATGVTLLTDREAEVLALVARGLSNRQIGERLFISGKTVSVHVSNLLAKLGVSGRAEAVAVASRRGLLPSVTD